ncbi:Rieske (2Fe-2S) protein [Aphanizomenon flos-aquae NRERC-008]|jgi:nitrite reductase/ring-hydroxylating ferredoxin subunit|uniref:Rieske (2Fe-2S) protein n=1 Tax=Aphanizomenon flos-aquae FACHB-1249 TaxID=2692889 RepID=A0ABR8IVR2_APHFL|nr:MULTISPECIES: Rieske (2Fe-2S) protein [Aphanizomenon]MDJ0506341.1 Rieske (2Fe-2S) protein [Nostocales cyanobacterium LE14-WE12]MBD2392349.1 Rieske (2Fe-2S) protein [Aphanizomenon flos-aquae FACHB-1171]MBD2558058.1 Rieske (2Fe-2S) protein [Aphanizomenon flos-aquae FACHB-1290]MBD2632804.1 Rieske (2Fe-2S) protein [Aphanizomenon sp. FACHB-1399]MBD2644354.1 Rieske (2Fe-2S) protein [Aphanizomenon sp. FACHB-1401]
MAWTQVLSANALTEGAREVVKVGERKILLLKHENQLYAVDDACPHLKLSLAKGKIEAGSLVCPFHRSAFDLNNGEVKTWCPFPPVVGKLLSMGSSEKTLPIYPLKVEEGNILIDV